MSLLSRLGSVLERIQVTSRPLTTFNYRFQHDEAAAAETRSSPQYTRSGFINKRRFMYIRKQQEKTDKTFSNRNARMLLSFLGNRMALETPDERRQLANDVFKRCPERDTLLYSHFLRTHLDNRTTISTAEIIQEMQSNGVEPDGSVYLRLLSINCMQGDLESAHHILRFMKNKGMPIPPSAFGHLASCHCIKGEPKRGREMLDYMYKNNLIITSEVVHSLCSGLVEARAKDELLDFLEFYARVRPGAKLNTYGVIDLMCKLIEAEYYDVLPIIYRFANPDTIDWELAIMTLQKYPGNGRHVLDLLKHLNIQLPYGNSEAFFIRAAFDSEICKSFTTAEEWREYLDAVDNVLPTAKHHMITEALRQVCFVNADMCFETLLKMKDMDVEMKQHMFVPISLSSLDNAEGLETFCKVNGIDYISDSRPLIQASCIMAKFSRANVSDPEVLRSFVDAVLKIEGLFASHMADSLMKMNKAENFSAIFFESLIEQFNSRSNPFSRYTHWQNLLSYMRKFGFSGKVNEQDAMAKLNRTHQEVLMPLLTATTTENGERPGFTKFQSRILPSYIAMVINKSFNFSQVEGKTSQLKLLMDLPLHMETAQLTKSYDSLARHTIDADNVNAILWHYVDAGEAEKVAQLYDEMSADLPPYSHANFIPPQLLGEKSLSALKSYLCSMHGSNTVADWIIYLSYLTNGMTDEADAFYRDDMELVEEVNDVLQTSAHLHRIPTILKQLFKLKGKASLLEFLDVNTIFQRLLILGHLDVVEELLAWADKEEIKLDTEIMKSAFNTLVKHGRVPASSQDSSEDTAIELVKGEITLAKLKKTIMAKTYISPSLGERICIDLAGTDDFDEGIRSFDRQLKSNHSAAVTQARLQYYLNKGEIENAIKWVSARASPNQITIKNKRGEIYAMLGKYFRENGADFSLLENYELEEEFVQHEVELFKFVKGESDQAPSSRICRALGKLAAEGQVDFDRVLKVALDSHHEKVTEVALGLFESRSPLFERCLEEMVKNNIRTFNLQTKLVNELRYQPIEDWNIAQLEMLFGRFPPIENDRLKIATNLLFTVIEGKSPRIMTQDRRDQVLQLMDSTVRHLPYFMHFADVRALYPMLRHTVRFSRVLSIDNQVENTGKPRAVIKANKNALDEASLNMLFGN